MKQVFIVTAGSYSDYHICAVFETEELAKQYIAAFEKEEYGAMEIETYELNNTAPGNGLCAFLVVIERNGNVHQVYRLESDKFSGSGAATTELYSPQHTLMDVYCFAKDKEHAVKIAGEKRRELVANGQWD